jgi:DNA-nicking Smr family endonuclease
MDFGDILKAWEREQTAKDERKGEASKPGTAQVSGKKANPDRVTNSVADKKPGPAVQEASPKSEHVHKAQALWLNRYGIPDEARRDEDAPRRTPLPKRELSRLPIDGTLDLHGMTVSDAMVNLELFFARAETSGWRKVLIVHGKGIHSKDGPILMDTVKRWLERRPSAGRSGPADAELGGGGATWVLLKGDQRSR